jgi:hypothetical protein
MFKKSLFSVTILIISSVSSIKAQDSFSMITADSITTGYFLAGRWGELISAGNRIIAQQIDFKYLRQRIGYAYFIKNDFINSKIHYLKAYEFDNQDPVTILYLYYCGLNLGDQAFARYWGSKTDRNTKKDLKLKNIKLIGQVDAEYNYKTGFGQYRSAPSYYRIGLNSQPGYRWSVYQSISEYFQTYDQTNQTIQFDYYGSMNFVFNHKLDFTASYHYLSANYASQIYTGNMLFGKVSYKFNRFTVAASGSGFRYLNSNNWQGGLETSYTFSGKNNFTMRANLYSLTDSLGNRLVLNPAAGLLLFRNLWIEGNAFVGNLKNFTSDNGLYIYNSQDETTFRTSLSLFYYFKKGFSLYTNYMFDRKNNDNEAITYFQHSITGGIVWKF